jgi:hypothetical protein
MPATDHLNPSLFHGTTHPFNAGDTIEPTDSDWSFEGTPMAFATPDLGKAQQISRTKAKMHNRKNPDDPKEGHVFEVEHMSGPADVWGLHPEVADTVGFRVKRRVEG